MLILKIFIYYIILFGTLFVMRSAVKMMAPMTMASLMFFIYLGSYLVLLVLEIGSQLSKKASEKDIKKTTSQSTERKTVKMSFPSRITCGINSSGNLDLNVIPAKAGIQELLNWIPASAGT